MPQTTYPDSVQRVLQVCRDANLPDTVQMFDTPAKTAETAAQAIGCDVTQIVKSLIFIAGDSPVLAMVSGRHRLSTEKLATLVGASVGRASAAQARDATGYAIGGIPPFGHTEKLPSFVDQTLMQFDTVWAAAGHPNSVFSIDPKDLVRIANAKVADLAE